jgi:hypothetical protein
MQAWPCRLLIQSHGSGVRRFETCSSGPNLIEMADETIETCLKPCRLPVALLRKLAGCAKIQCQVGPWIVFVCLVITCCTVTL